MQNVLAEHEMLEKFGGGKANKQGQAVETISCQANNVGQFRQAFRIKSRRVKSLSLGLYRMDFYF